MSAETETRTEWRVEGNPPDEFGADETAAREWHARWWPTHKAALLRRTVTVTTTTSEWEETE